MSRRIPLVLAACLTFVPAAVQAVEVEITLRGSRASMLRQNGIAKLEAYSFLRTPDQVRDYVERGNLVPLPGSEDYAVIAGFPYARPVVRSFIERLAGDYRDSCGERLVVTSLTRPSTRQPSNASPLSVHPAGMAVDLRVSARPECRSWLMAELLQLEEMGLLDATLEHRPPHFHVAVFPAAYGAWEQALMADSVATEAVRLLEDAVAAREAELVAAADHADVSTRAPAPAHAPAALIRMAAWIARLVLPLNV
jgi:hypothetical protein